MDEWVNQNPTIVASIATGLLVGSIVLLALWLWSRRNGRLLSRELDDADRELAARDATIAEQGAKLRIVRELHEVAVHSVSTIVSQSDAARYVVESDPSAAARSAGQIAEIARGARADLRRIVTIATEPADAAGQADAAEPATDPAGTEPGHEKTHSNILTTEELLAADRFSSLEVSFVESGESFPLQSGAEVAIHRILEEALDNALRYGGEGTAVTVSFAWTREGLKVLIDDDGIQAAARRDGRGAGEVAGQRGYSVQDDLDSLTDVVAGDGITEMRERVAAWGGLFTASTVAGVGFSISAIFPTIRYDNGVHSVNFQG